MLFFGSVNEKLTKYYLKQFILFYICVAGSLGNLAFPEMPGQL